MEREGIFVICLILATLLVIGGLVACFIYLPPSIELKNEIDVLTVGQEQSIKLTSFGLPQPKDAFYYASEDPDVVSVDENGVLMPSREGKTQIYVQSRSNRRQRLIFEVESRYDVCEISEAVVEKTEIYEVDPASHGFFERNGYTKRVSDDKFLELAHLVVGKMKDQYVFTDLYRSARVQGAELVALTDWVSDDVLLSLDALSDLDLCALACELAGIDAALVDEREVKHAQKSLAEQIRNTMEEYQYAVYLSSLPTDYEYKVSIRVDYSVYRAVNYYSRGLLDGTGALVGDIMNLSAKSFLNSYTYKKELYELEIDGCELVIERRIKGK